MKGAAGWGQKEASLVPTAGGPTGRRTSASDTEPGGVGVGVPQLGLDSAGDEVFSKTQCNQAAPGPQRLQMP